MLPLLRPARGRPGQLPQPQLPPSLHAVLRLPRPARRLLRRALPRRRHAAEGVAIPPSIPFTEISIGTA
jgi:hypothetical protein